MKLPYFIDRFFQKHFSMLWGEITVFIHDSDGVLVHTHKQICHSVTANFLSNVYMQMHNFSAAGTYGFTAPFTTNRDLKTVTAAFVTKEAGTYIRSEGTVNLDNTGIIVGRGAPVVAPLTANLTTKIAHGSGANQLLYQQQNSPEGVTIAGNETRFRFIRSFINSSGATINVSEVGMLQLSSDQYLIFIDPLTPAQDVLDGQTITIEISYITNT